MNKKKERNKISNPYNVVKRILSMLCCELLSLDSFSIKISGLNVLPIASVKCQPN